LQNKTEDSFIANKKWKASIYKKQKAILYKLTENSSDKIQSQNKGLFSNKIDELL
jgi:hypothetical protein